mmetsp:Transcript_134194/g.199663  ORF Transcript_134194/g.199663 Transcript_134194/m.199663 type:complete len:231 (-) Transcript_134194:40-732(-)
MIPLITSKLARSCAIATPKAAVTRRSIASYVRLIAVEDLPHGKAYKGDVVNVRAGYARNFLIPKKMAVYATPQNFEKYEISDPNIESEEERQARFQRESSMSEKDERLLKESDLLKKYLRNKTLKIYRVVDPNSVDTLHPGIVTARNIREKLSKQLKIDLDPEEPVHILSEEPMDLSELDDKLQSMVDEFEGADSECQIKVRRLGTYLARIGLAGGYSIPLTFNVQQRVP